MASIQGIYVALFGRPADPAGLAFFNTATKGGTDITAIGDLASTAEYKERFANQSNSEIVNAIYKALFNRDAEANGLKFFTDALANGTFSIKNIAIAILDGARTNDLTVVTNKIAAADLFTKSLDTPAKIEAYKGSNAAKVGINLLSAVTADTKTIPTTSDIDRVVTTGLSVTTPTTPSTDSGSTTPTVDKAKAIGVAFQQEVLTGLKISDISDSLFKSQWYIKNDGGRGNTSAVLDVNIAGAWADGYTGKGVRVAINDDGMDLNHADLTPNLLKELTYNSVNKVTGADAYEAVGDGEKKYTPDVEANEHGTVVGSIVGMPANGTGMVGMAPTVTLISGLAVAEGADVPALFNYMTSIAKADVSVNSYGADPAFSENFWAQAPKESDRTYLAAIEKAGKEGRGGLGTVTEVSAGNKGQQKAEASMTGTTNNKYIITAGAMNELGDKASYSTPGASVLVSSFGGENLGGKDQSENSGYGVASADITGATLGYNKTSIENGDYAFQNTGTSYSGPMVGAAAALILQANPLLGFRDVANILALTARAVGTTNNYVETKGSLLNFGGMQFSREVGFGLIDVTAAVRLAASWTDTAKTAANWQNSDAKSAAAAAVISNGDGLTVTANLTKNVIIERMEFDLNLRTDTSNDLKAVITSPNGTTITLFDEPMVAKDGAAWPETFQIGATAFFGEQSAGTWTLQLIDKNTGTNAEFKELTVRAWGSEVTPDSHYVLANSFSGTKTLTDASGTDLIDAAAVSSAVTINLNTGQTSTIANGSFVIAAGVQIENAFGGAGNDTLIGNDLGNVLRGNGGADTLTGNGGADIFMFGNVNESTAQTFDTITDFVVGTDKIDLRLIDANLKVANNQEFKFLGQTSTAQANSLAFSFQNGDTRLFADADGDANTIEFQVVLTGQKNLTASDFFGLELAA